MDNSGESSDDVSYEGVYEQLPNPSVRRYDDSDQTDWELQFISTLTAALTHRYQDAGTYEVDRLEWSPRIFTLVVRVWREEQSELVGWREHLPTLRSQFTPDAANVVAGAWHTGEFFPRGIPPNFSPDSAGIHWIRRC